MTVLKQFEGYSIEIENGKKIEIVPMHVYGLVFISLFIALIGFVGIEISGISNISQPFQLENIYPYSIVTAGGFLALILSVGYGIWATRNVLAYQITIFNPQRERLPYQYDVIVTTDVEKMTKIMQDMVDYCIKIIESDIKKQLKEQEKKKCLNDLGIEVAKRIK